MYSKSQLASIFMNWPSYATSERLTDAEIRADVILAVARYEGISEHEAERGMNQTWLTIARMSNIQFIQGAVAFANTIQGTINGEV